MKRRLRKIDILDIENICLNIILTIYIGILLFVGMPCRGEGPCMYPTLNEKEVSFQQFFPMRYERGDVVAFRENGEILAKRIIGLPGETITYSCGVTYINGEELKEEYRILKDERCSFDTKITLGDDEYFVLGDNGKNSYDSRYYGAVKKSSFYGKFFDINNTPVDLTKVGAPHDLTICVTFPYYLLKYILTYGI